MLNECNKNLFYNNLVFLQRGYGNYMVLFTVIAERSSSSLKEFEFVQKLIRYFEI